MSALTRISLIAAVLAMSLQACTYPTSQVTRGESRPAIVVEGAPKGAILVVDGISHGEARQYDGNPDQLLIESGMHSVQVILGDDIIISRDVYVASGETRVLTVKRQ